MIVAAAAVALYLGLRLHKTTQALPSNSLAGMYGFKPDTMVRGPSSSPTSIDSMNKLE